MNKEQNVSQIPSMEDYVCCRELAQQLDVHFFKGDSKKFFEVRNILSL
jgi:hypothetical protein